MREVSITQHRDKPTTVWIDGRVVHAETKSQIGTVLRNAGIKPDQRVSWMNARGKTDRLNAHHWLQHAPPPEKERA